MDTEKHIHIGKTHQLFLYDDIIEKKKGNIRHKVNSAKKYENNPVLKESDWESEVLLYGSVIREKSGIYRMWYYSYSTDRSERYMCHATSEDGIIWRKPLYDIIKYNGKKTSAVFGRLLAGDLREPQTVIFDPTDSDDRRYKFIFMNKRFPDKQPSADKIKAKYSGIIEKYKSEGLDGLAARFEKFVSMHTERGARTIGTAVSPDGIHWNDIQEEAIPDIQDISHLMYDPLRKKYCVYGRDFYVPEDVHVKYSHEDWYKNDFKGRAIQLSESDDFKNWSLGKFVLSAEINDKAGDELYSMAVFTYEGLYIGLVQVMHAKGDDRTLDIHLAISRDGIKWKRIGDGNPFISLGDIGEWDRFMHAISSIPVDTGDGLRFYYSGTTARHGGYTGADAGCQFGPQEEGTGKWYPENGEPVKAIGFAEIKKDRFADYEASFDGGYILTKPFIIDGANLHVNVKSDYGLVNIEFLDAGMKNIEGLKTSVSTDSIDELVAFSKTLKDVIGERPVRLKFTLKNAKLFSFWFD